MKNELAYLDEEIKKLEYRIANPTEYHLTPTIKVKINDGACYRDKLKMLNNIKQALTTKIKKGQALDIIIKKEVNLYKIRDFMGLSNFETWSSYNAYRKAFNFTDKEMLTEEEFNLIKEMLKCI